MENTEYLKRLAGEAAVGFVASGMVLGLGHGSTVIWALRLIAAKIARHELRDILGVPCSSIVAAEAEKLGIPLTTLEEHPVVDLTIDGADEVDSRLDLIKGRGGALLREKIVAQASRREIIVVDGAKVTGVLGRRSPVPVELIPFGYRCQTAYLSGLGARRVTLRLGPDDLPRRSDEGNYLADCDFGPIDDPAGLAARLDRRAGIVAHGLFLGLTTDLLVADPTGIHHHSRDAA